MPDAKKTPNTGLKSVKTHDDAGGKGPTVRMSAPGPSVNTENDGDAEQLSTTFEGGKQDC